MPFTPQLLVLPEGLRIPRKECASPIPHVGFELQKAQLPCLRSVLSKGVLRECRPGARGLLWGAWGHKPWGGLVVGLLPQEGSPAWT